MHARSFVHAALAAIVSLTLASALGCGEVTFDGDAGPIGDDDDDDDDDLVDAGPDALNDVCRSDDLPLEDYYGCMAAAIATLYDNCVGDSSGVDFNHNGDARIIGDLSIALARSYIPDAIDLNVITYDPAGAAACVAHLRDLDCGLALAGDDPLGGCRDFIGSIPDGDVCYSRLDCATAGSECPKPSSSGTGRDLCMPGTCVPPGQLNGACSPSNRCEYGTRCVDGTCVTGNEGTGCRSACTDGCDVDCDTELYCNVNTCSAPLAEGAPCTRDQQCDLGSRCVPAPGGGETCQNARVEGAVCEFAGFGACVGQLYCAVENDATTGTCAPTPRQGDACGLNDFCPVIDKPLLVCTEGTCELPGDLGATCASSSECQHRYFCSTDVAPGGPGTCVAAYAAGADCTRDSHCLSGICGIDSKCVDYTSCFI